MPIVVYIVAIVVIAFGVFLFFFFNARADKKRVARLKEEQKEKNAEPKIEPIAKIEPVVEQEKKIDVQLEDFYLDGEPKIERDGRKRAMPSRTSMFSQNKINEMFAEDDEIDFENEQEILVASEDLNKNFEEYEKFLRENLDFDDDEVTGENSGVNGTNKDFDEFMETLSPKAREFMMAEVLSRKNIETEED